jgi:hypothetical protein
MKDKSLKVKLYLTYEKGEGFQEIKDYDGKVVFIFRLLLSHDKYYKITVNISVLLIGGVFKFH